MIEFKVEDMSCGHCVSTITKAVKAAEPQAVVEVDLPSKIVRIEGAANADKVRDAISESGFTPVQAK